MVLVLSRKSTIAWFKLADLVERKEKERALTIYRLLVHSLNDFAYRAQLEGDLLAAFNDARAIESYRRAALIYEKSDRLFSAALVYEQIALLHGSREQSSENLKRAYELYQLLGATNKAVHCIDALARLADPVSEIKSEPLQQIQL